MGLLHSPQSVPASGPGVVLCNPLGHEAMCVHSTYRHLAERLAASGLPALRFDYHGTGDSSGRPGDPGRVQAWIDSVRSAISEVRARSGVRRVALFGVGFGAALAAIAATEEGGVDFWIGWAPAVSGRSYVRELRAARMLESSRAPASKRTDGSEEIMGYLFSRETLASMSEMDLLALPVRIGERVLVVPRYDGGGSKPASEEARLVECLRAQGADVRLAAESGYARMMCDPYRAEVPSKTLDTIVGWLRESEYNEPPIPPSVGPPSSTGNQPSKPSSARPTGNVLTTITRGGGTAVRETPFFFGDGERMFGVLTEPDGPLRADRPTFCFLNVGADHHVGPHRMNVELAREVASLGYLAFRFDLPGLGDSLPAPGGRENVIYSKGQVADLTSAMDALKEVRGAERFVLVGVCSGAYLAFHTAVLDLRVVGQVLVNSFAFEWKEGDPVEPTERRTYPSTRFYTRALSDRRVWVRMLSGEVNVRGIAAVLFERSRIRASAGLRTMRDRLRRRSDAENEVERAFVTMCHRGVESLMVFSFVDGGLDMIAKYLGHDASRMKGKKHFSLDIVDGVDHTFRSMASQERLRAIVAGFATTHYP
jgi:alpha-beta hydrolase superfamily lysophospholipase